MIAGFALRGDSGRDSFSITAMNPSSGMLLSASGGCAPFECEEAIRATLRPSAIYHRLRPRSRVSSVESGDRPVAIDYGYMSESVEA